jgi:hypothetical protein
VPRHRRGRDARVRARRPDARRDDAGPQIRARRARRRAGAPPAPERPDARGRVRARGGGESSRHAHSRPELPALRRRRAAASGAPGPSSRAPASASLIASARSSGCCSSPGCPSSSAPSRSTSRPTSRRRRAARPDAETFREFLDQQGVFVFFVTIYVGAGLIANDRRANALQIYLSKPLTRAEYIAGKMAILFLFLLLVTWAAGDAAAAPAGRLRGQLRVPPEQPVPASRPSRCSRCCRCCWRRSRCWRCRRSRRAAASSASCMRAHVLHRAMFGAARHHRQQRPSVGLAGRRLEQVGDVIFRLTPRYDTPRAVSLLIVLAGARRRRSRSRCSSAACAAWRW